jgi:hypothetical protein
MDTNKLASILAKSKRVMRKADEIQGNGQIDQGGGGMSQNVPTVDGYNISDSIMEGNVSKEAPKHTFANKDTSRMPKEIIEAMINNPIEVHTPGSFEATPDLVEAVRGADTKRAPQKKVTKANKDSIREIIREELEKVIDSYIDKRLLNEEIQVKVGNTVFSGNLRPLPKRKKK